MSQELNDYLNSLDWNFGTQWVDSTYLYYLILQKNGKSYKLLMNGEEEPSDLKFYMEYKHNVIL